MLLACFVSASIAGCALLSPARVKIGASEQEVVDTLGRPTHRYRSGSEQLLEYMQGPFGQTTYMARIDKTGRLVSFEQVLTLEKFGLIRVGESRKDDVLHIVGAPSSSRHFGNSALEGWSYPFKESGVWDSMMTVYFDDAGIVRKLENGPDPVRLIHSGRD